MDNISMFDDNVCTDTPDLAAYLINDMDLLASLALELDLKKVIFGQKELID